MFSSLVLPKNAHRKREREKKGEKERKKEKSGREKKWERKREFLTAPLSQHFFEEAADSWKRGLKQSEYAYYCNIIYYIYNSLISLVLRYSNSVQRMSCLSRFQTTNQSESRRFRPTSTSFSTPPSFILLILTLRGRLRSGKHGIFGNRNLNGDDSYGVHVCSIRRHHTPHHTTPR